MDDEAVIEALCEVCGIGRWSAEMLLVFNLGRPDVLRSATSACARASATS